VLAALLSFLAAFAAFGVPLFVDFSERAPFVPHLLLTLGAFLLLIAVRLTSRLLTSFLAYVEGSLFCVDALRFGKRRPECRLPLEGLQKALPYAVWKQEQASSSAAFYRYANRFFVRRCLVLTFDDGGQELAILIDPSPALLHELERFLSLRKPF